MPTINFPKLSAIPQDLMEVLSVAQWEEREDQQDAYITWRGVRYHARNCAIVADGDRCDLSLEPV